MTIPSKDDGPLKVMVVGIPNVGKSSVINALRRRFYGTGKGAMVGGLPGMTRHVSQFIKVSVHTL